MYVFAFVPLFVTRKSIFITLTTNDFKIAAFPMKADGTPDLENLSFEPEQSKWNVEGAHPVIKGKASLNGSEEWQTVTD